jgi:arylsulfatase A-like enzyme
VLIIIDTLRADRLGAYGCPEDASPQLDALARQGVRFDEVVAPTSWTRASIGSLLTSLHPRSLGIFHDRRDALDDRFTTLAEVLWSAGYHTLGATANPNINSVYSFHQGFDTYVDSDVLFPWMPAERHKVKLQDRPLPAGQQIYRALLEKLAKPDDRPFYVQATVMEVHEHGMFRGTFETRAVIPPGPYAHRGDALYLRAVRRATDEAAAFVHAVSELPGGRNTLFVITSDHGEGLRDHPHVSKSTSHGFHLYESQLRVPLVLYHPDGAIPAGRVVEQPVRLLDVMPTILAFAGVRGPPAMEGRSLLPLARGGGDVALPDVFFAETRFQRHYKLAAYTSEWKYIENREGTGKLPPRALHAADVTEDGSFTDVSASHPEVVAQLAARMQQWERSHPPAPPSPISEPPTQEALRQLELLGYLR